MSTCSPVVPVMFEKGNSSDSIKIRKKKKTTYIVNSLQSSLPLTSEATIYLATCAVNGTQVRDVLAAHIE